MRLTQAARHPSRRGYAAHLRMTAQFSIRVILRSPSEARASKDDAARDLKAYRS